MLLFINYIESYSRLFKSEELLFKFLADVYKAYTPAFFSEDCQVYDLTTCKMKTLVVEPKFSFRLQDQNRRKTK